jgi:hypothetical protein
MIKPPGTAAVARIGLPSRGLHLVASPLVWALSPTRKLNSYNPKFSLLTIEWE